MLYVEENYHWFDEPFSGDAGLRRVGSQRASNLNAQSTKKMP